MTSFSKTEDKNTEVVDKFKKMFVDGKVSGEVKTIYAGYNYKAPATEDIYATAIGGELKYEIAELNGFNGAAAFSTSQDVNFITGDRDKNQNNPEMSSSYGNYTELTQAYINYNYNGLNLRIGRQIIDTPLADSDDIRMIKNTFEAYIATYEINNFTFMAGNLQRWQGVDAGLENGYSNETGKDGTWLSGVVYSDDIFDVNAWYYNISKSLSAIYADVDYHNQINKDILIHGGIQYLSENELDSSGIEANIYGLMSELVLYDLGIGVAYNKADKKSLKESFSGFGGGTLYTNMDTMILNEIAKDRDAQALVAGFHYVMSDFNLLYAYGDFDGDKNSVGVKEHIVEQDIGVEYSYDDNIVASAFYITSSDEESSVKTDYDWDRIQINLSYTF